MMAMMGLTGFGTTKVQSSAFLMRSDTSDIIILGRESRSKVIRRLRQCEEDKDLETIHE